MSARLPVALIDLQQRVAARVGALVRARPRLVTAAGGAVVLLALGLLSFGPLVRARARAAAARRGLVLDVGRVTPGWFAVELHDVDVHLEGVDGIGVHAPGIRVRLDATFHPTEIDVTGARVDARGAPDALVDALSGWRARRGADTASSSGGHHTVVRIDGAEIAWSGADGESVLVSNASLARDDDGLRATVGQLHAAYAALALDVADVAVDVAPGGLLHDLRAKTVDVAYTPHDDGASAAASASANEPAPPPLPDPTPKRGAKAGAPSAPLFAASDPLLPLPHLHKLRARLAHAATLLGARLGDDAAVGIDHIALHYDRGGGTPRLSLGPGALALARHADRLDVEFKTDADAPAPGAPPAPSPAPAPGAPPGPSSASSHGSALSLRVSLPVAQGDVRVALEGGPVALALLGVHEGGGGLTDVDHAALTGKGNVVLAAAGDGLTFDVDLGVRGLGIHLPRLSPDVVHGLDLGIRARGVLSEPTSEPNAAHPEGELRLDDSELTLGSLKVDAHGRLAQAKDHAEGSLGFEVPASACQSLFESIPAALVPDLAGAQMEGTFRAKGIFAFDSRKLDDLELAYDIDDLCKLVVVPEALAKDRFDKPFTHRIYHPDGSLGEEETGPGTDNWSDIERISPYMEVAVLTTEDGAFFHHHGFNHAAIRSSLIANLKARRFVRGASTISMQTAKNLFLFRDKTLARKLEEVILTDYLEQNFTKDEIMQLYLNVIEFGPDLYGITAAAQHYFGRKPEELNLAESLFLSSLLPRPVGYHKLYEKGELPESWVKNLHALMEIALKTGKISDAELKEGLGESVVFHKPEDPPPPPRPPITGVHFAGDDVGWQPVE